MLAWFRALMPKEDRFFALFDRHAATLVDGARALQDSVGDNAARLNALTERVIDLEGRADDMHNAGLKALFAASATEPMRFIVGQEIYDHLEKVMDRFEDVANRISSIVVEHL